ncbi:hypothetical protein C2G38_2030545 [Gigaspora rosea]|uniref:DRBM domain-containing protein n=1 Tax=Gigaspora rosea TaxID=44941 RepID=A0A397VYH0_9GLOM|nr:hypothetical protein C2G38_2030545 [Gigaspora rosea]
MPKDKRHRQGYRKKLRYNNNRIIRKIALKQTSSQLADNNAYDPQNPQLTTATQNPLDIGNSIGDSDKAINPITFLNTLHHKLKTPNPPHYDCTPDPQGGGFYCTLMFFDQTFKSTVPKPKKQLAKEAVAMIAMESFEKQMSKTFQQVRQTLLSANSAPKKPSKVSKGSRQFNRMLHSTDTLTQSAQWLRKFLDTHVEKRPCVMLLEFCQFHQLGHPIYPIRTDVKGCVYMDCVVAKRIFTPELSFFNKKEAKDYISDKAFNILYQEFCEQEQRQVEERVRSERSKIDFPSGDTPSSTVAFVPQVFTSDNNEKSAFLTTPPATTNTVSIGSYNTTTNIPPLPAVGSQGMSSNYDYTNNGAPTFSTLDSRGSVSKSGSSTETYRETQSSFVWSNASELGPPPTSALLENALHQTTQSTFRPPSVTTSPQVVFPTIGFNSYQPPQQPQIPPVRYQPPQQPLLPSVPFQPLQQPPMISAPYQQLPMPTLPYQPPQPPQFSQRPRKIKNKKNSLHKGAYIYKRYISLLFEFAQAQHWANPEFEFQNMFGEFKGMVTINGRTFVGTKLCKKKSEAKEDVAEVAYKFFVDNPIYM